ncbi:MAG: copper-binding protein [Bradyrhizobium sp.]|uniref:copper-binding protein n=1 Tax=Bradyrhizobium sp. TaxID=376 RepID=UPI001A31D550|nr:copper-binding protein [Bradyrhizobium sp.]MBJ7406429.1 copper-binding protein [Bradyrhizobium sp.]
MRQAVVFVAIALGSAAGIVPAAAQTLTSTPSEWMEKLNREHRYLVSPSGHVHAKGQIKAIDSGLGAAPSVTILTEDMQSADGSIRMQAMEMPFHVTNRRMLKDLRPGDFVQFEVARLRNAVMITNIRKSR